MRCIWADDGTVSLMEKKTGRAVQPNASAPEPTCRMAGDEVEPAQMVSDTFP